MHDALRRIDLNLLPVFDALYRHRSVAAAADELAMSPSACSHALSRLRSALADELFVRYGAAMQPTAQAEQLAPSISDALHLLSDRLAHSVPFLPAESQQTFTFAASDFTAFTLLPELVSAIENEAPHIRFKVVQTTHRDAMDDLAAGRAQFVLGFSDEYSKPYDGIATIASQPEKYAVARSARHSRITDTLTLEQYLSERHVAVVPWSDDGSVIDASLARLGLRRDVAIELPTMMAAPYIVAGSDFLATLPARVIGQLQGAVPLIAHPVPFQTPEFTLKLLFHSRHARLPGHLWVRERIASIFGHH
ncbi:LysR family transcriptional regulator [Pseudoduganella danionis]|uniref:LysR family transcriptional regulator n=1 Tax=Pseudoduganella danionis TaxID=1890295 RepID=A0ABW9SGV6_9BURK|nr:LysR family transcriptional regulator [Pseudoduganella danionis]MTW31268.1 LysR family transcriptional regulator [Pseudoduganella danionis]